jgi:hypothetical protein
VPFVEKNPRTEDYWRSVILFGRNVASYKFALAKSLLELADSERSFISLEELALPFARNIAEHLKHTPKQATSTSSRFLNTIREFNKGEINQDALARKTVTLGFQNVIDAFHVINREAIPIQFFVDERKERGGISVTDELFKLKESVQFFEPLPGDRRSLAVGRDRLGTGSEPITLAGTIRQCLIPVLRSRPTERAGECDILTKCSQRLPKGKVLLLLPGHQHRSGV